MKIVMLSSGDRVPSSRFRMLPYVRHFRNRGHRCTLASSIPQKYEWFPQIGFRLSQRLKRLIRCLHWYQSRIRGDEIVVIAGTEKGKRGKIIQVVPKKERVIVEGINMIKKHVRRNQEHPEGAILEREGSIHISNVMKAERYDTKRANA